MWLCHHQRWQVKSLFVYVSNGVDLEFGVPDRCAIAHAQSNSLPNITWRHVVEPIFSFWKERDIVETLCSQCTGWYSAEWQWVRSTVFCRATSFLFNDGFETQLFQYHGQPSLQARKSYATISPDDDSFWYLRIPQQWWCFSTRSQLSKWLHRMYTTTYLTVHL